jgi:hypothetical protein
LSSCPVVQIKIPDFGEMKSEKPNPKSGAWGQNNWTTGQKAYLNIYIL